jgi:hypothetical protein
MPLYVVSFTEHGGYRCQCRIRAAAVADHIALAVQKISHSNGFSGKQMSVLC